MCKNIIHLPCCSSPLPFPGGSASLWEPPCTRFRVKNPIPPLTSTTSCHEKTFLFLLSVKGMGFFLDFLLELMLRNTQVMRQGW